MNTVSVIETMADVILVKVLAEHIRSDDSAETTEQDRAPLDCKAGGETLCIEPCRQWKSDYRESFNAKLRDEYLSNESFYSLKEAAVIIG